MKSDLKALAEVYSRIITESNGRRIIKGNVYLESLYLKKLPEWLADVEVDGDFGCINNMLTTLENAPRYVRRTFYCYNNRLISLKGAPREVIGGFHCFNNRLRTLQDAPRTVGGGFDCSYNNLKSLEGAPESVFGRFECRGNAVEFSREDVRAVSHVSGQIITNDDGWI
jgi:hypothetical protein